MPGKIAQTKPRGGMTRQSRYDFDYVFPQWDVSIVRPAGEGLSQVKKDKNQLRQAKRAEKVS